MSDNSVFAAIGSVLGYIGAEAATKRCLERLLWPQRAYSNFSLKAVPLLALLTPLGGPLHKVGLDVLDGLFAHRLFEGSQAGHMLGTGFFPKLGWTYTLWTDDGEKIETNELRNNVWVRAMDYIPAPIVRREDLKGTTGDRTSAAEKAAQAAHPVRAVVALGHFTVTKATDADKASALPFVSEAVRSLNISDLVSILVSESSAIFLTIGLLIAFKSLWGIWWLAPLILRLVSVIFALEREGLVPLGADALDEPIYNYEIHCPQSSGNFMLLTGPRSAVEQFFVHYGHPVRNRFRELLQFGIIILVGSTFPLGLFFSAIWMPIGLQYAWLSHQLFLVLVMLLSRYSHGGEGTTTEAKIAREFSKRLRAKNFSDSGAEASILFGQKRNSAATIKVQLSLTYHSRYTEGNAYMDRLLRRPQSPGP